MATLIAPAIPKNLAVDLESVLRQERSTFAIKVRVARAILGISQEQLARQIGLTQKSVHRIEQGSVEPKMRTVIAIQQFWADHGIAFEDIGDGGFRLAVVGSALQGD